MIRKFFLETGILLSSSFLFAAEAGAPAKKQPYPSNTPASFLESITIEGELPIEAFQKKHAEIKDRIEALRKKYATKADAHLSFEELSPSEQEEMKELLANYETFSTTSKMFTNLITDVRGREFPPISEVEIPSPNGQPMKAFTTEIYNVSGFVPTKPSDPLYGLQDVVLLRTKGYFLYILINPNTVNAQIVREDNFSSELHDDICIEEAAANGQKEFETTLRAWMFAVFSSNQQSSKIVTIGNNVYTLEAKGKLEISKGRLGRDAIATGDFIKEGRSSEEELSLLVDKITKYDGALSTSRSGRFQVYGFAFPSSIIK